ncbi:hypothetical protein NP493_37g07022 [Ridgeia piscesae]|uniref:Uncharacterized protein n=1 Tax=Ridgeia piscesae TaxID=27915 RepID=A0AAD9UJU2_RIDPI|nr:hypothetical protein NP493_37g07022 [Ridgeia piscesae]
MFLNMMNGTLAFCILALTSSSVPPFLLIVLPRYVNESVSSSGPPFIVMGLLFFVMAFIILVLLLLMLSPNCVDTVFSSSVFPASVDGCVRGERGHPQSPGPPTAPRCPLYPISSICCSLFHDPVYGEQE